MIRLVSKAAVAASLAAAALVALPATARAANGCTGDPYNVHVLSTPVTVDVVPPHGNVVYDWARVCVGVPGGIAYEEYGVVVHPFGPFGPAACSAPDNYTGLATGVITSVLGFGAGGGIGVSVSPQVCFDAGTRTFTVALPVLICSQVCVGSGLGTTGVIVGSFGLTGGPAGSTGAGVQLVGTGLLVNGTLVPIGPTPFVGGGVGGGGVAPAVGPVIACGPLNLVCVPGSAGIYYNGGAFLVLAVPVLGTVPVGLGAPQCVPVFTVAPAPRAC
ncbi:MAG TPA: hypothetical protein VGX28_09105 [Frankiaceae bacterium]|jgi:hypothetical protein|nr:hypothetical protein [Frankiaceae bacterium]